MTTSVKSYLESITRALNEIDKYNGANSTVTSFSQVSKNNSHRPFLESIRNDLYHFDEEKKVRIIFNIENYLEEHPNEDQELVIVLKRVLEVVNHYKEHQQILLSPEKKVDLSPERVSKSSLESVRRELFKFESLEEKK